MTSRDFAFWLQGFFELTGTDELTADQVKLIKAHLSLVFKHDVAMEHPIRPSRPSRFPLRPILDKKDSVRRPGTVRC